MLSGLSGLSGPCSTKLPASSAAAPRTAWVHICTYSAFCCTASRPPECIDVSDSLTLPLILSASSFQTTPSAHWAPTLWRAGRIRQKHDCDSRLAPNVPPVPPTAVQQHQKNLQSTRHCKHPRNYTKSGTWAHFIVQISTSAYLIHKIRLSMSFQIFLNK